MIKELHAGDRQIPASGWNEMRAAVHNITPAQQQYYTGKFNPVYVTVKNATGYDLPAFSVVKLSGATYSRSGDTFINLALKNGVEINGVVPDAASNTVAITQAACTDGEYVKAIVSGATSVRLIPPASGSSMTYRYAKPVAGHVDYMEASNVVTNTRVIWSGSVASASSPGVAYILLDNIDDRQTFTVPVSLASVAKKGAVFRVVLGNDGWVIQTSGSGKYVLAVCQDDMDDNAVDPYQMPFYTPEQNYGILPNVTNDPDYAPTTTDSSGLIRRCGVGHGDYDYSNKRLDYAYHHGQYSYEPVFTYTGAAVNAGDAANPIVGIEIEGHTYNVDFPAMAGSGIGSLTAYPDAGDRITVQVEESISANYGASVTAIQYPTDFAVNSSIVVENTMLLGRGWDEDYIPNTSFKYAIKVKTNALI